MKRVPWTDALVLLAVVATVYVLVRPRSHGQDLVVAAGSIATAVVRQVTDLANN